MKKILCLLSVSFFAIMILIPSVVNAADVSVGATAWYATWHIKSTSSNTNNGGGGGTPNSIMGPELMVGPALSVRFAQDWTLAEVFLYSATKYEMPNGPGGGKMDIARMDSDTTLNYSINRYFKIFPGLKFMRFNYTGGYHESVGPGFGLGTTLPLSVISDNLFVIINGSGAYLFGEHKSSNSGSSSGSNSVGMREYGYNLTAGLAYYFDAISTTVNVGYRYQFFHTKFDNNNNNDDLDHTFQGFNMSVIYSF